MRFLKWSVGAVTVVTVVLFASDKITLQGERTIYTVDCRDGAWRGRECVGRVVVADQFRFRAPKPHREVLFWTVGATELSGKFMDCDIEDGRNWRCKPNADAVYTIALQMSKGDAVADSAGLVRTFHAVAKWRWLLLRWGIPAGSDSDG